MTQTGTASSTTPSISAPTRFYYDSLGRETSSTDPLGFTSFSSYDSLGRIATQTDKTGGTMSYTYYATNHANAGLVSKITDAAGKATYHAYNSRGHRTHTWGDVPYPEMRVYDAVYGDMTELRTFQGGTDWASSSLPSGFSGTAGITRFYYDTPSGVLTNKTDAATNAVTFSYYRNNLVKTRTWARGVVTTNYYNEFSELAGKAYSDGTTAITNSNFNTFGQPQQIVDAAGTHDLVYDYAERLLSETIGSVQTTFAYDRVKGLKQRTISNGSENVQHDFGYDAFGRVAFITNGAAKVSYGYLANSDLVRFQTNQQGTNTVLTTRRWEFGTRLGSISHLVGGQPFQSDNYIYDALNRRTRATLEDGSAWVYGYNNRDEVISGKRYWEDFTPTSGQQFAYQFDNIGNRTLYWAGGDASGSPAGLRQINYQSNTRNRYVSIITPGAFDVLGAAHATATVAVNGTSGVHRHGEYFHKQPTFSNTGTAVSCVVTSTATLGTNVSSVVVTNLLPPLWQTAVAYDADGNLTQEGVWHYKWDAENRLVQMTNVSSLPSASRLKLVFTNDHAGHRVAKKVFPWGSSDWSTTAATDLRCIYTSDLLGAELNGSTAAFIRSYTWGLDILGTLEDAAGIGGLVIATHHGGSATNLFATYDGNGNVQGLVRADDSTIAARYEYGPFGEAMRASGPFGNQNPIRWSSKYTDSETGLVDYWLRYYSPALGRWINTDPIEEEGGLNLYAFALNNPLNLVDPFGTTTGGGSEQAVVVGGASAVGGVSGAQAISILSRVRNAVDTFNAIQDFTADIIDAVEGDSDELLADLMFAAQNALTRKLTKNSSSLGSVANWGPQHGGRRHWDRIVQIAEAMKKKGWGNIRVNKRQVDKAGNAVGKNRPDVSGVNPRTGKQYNIEIDSKRSTSKSHQQTVNRNDPNAKGVFIVLP